MSEVSKWVCEYCTYENWPSAVKCTLCRGTKPPQLIGPPLFRTNTIDFSCSNLVEKHEEEKNRNEINREDGGGTTTKWSCSRCTYSNWLRSTKCSQCLAPRREIPMGLEITREFGVTGRSVRDSSSDRVDDSRVSTPDPISEINLNELNNRPSLSIGGGGLSSGGAKWACWACTYENWPKSLKCVLCLTPRRSGSPPSLLGTPLLLDHGVESHPAGAGTSSTSTSDTSNNYEREMRLRQLRKNVMESDRRWLGACLGVVDGDANPVEAYLSTGGDPSRQLTQSEVNLLDRPSAFDVGHTLVHLAIRFHREDLLALLLAAADTSESVGVRKRVPSHVSPDLATDLRRHVSASLRQRKGDFPCHFVVEMATFSLPSEVEDLPPEIQEHLLDELLDRSVQKELEEESPIINWSLELTERLGSRLYALWNRTAGDCLLDSVLQATWGIFDRDNTLRRALSDSLHDAASTFYPRWKEYEASQANLLHFSLDESQCQQDWAFLLSLASQPGASLEQMHIFALAHILRRPIVVYGVKFVKSFRGEAIGFAPFEGVYLPLLWEQSFCWKTPISLGYTRGHFSALIPMEPDTDNAVGAGANIRSHDDLKVVFLPLTTSDGKLLPVHFLSDAEVGHEEQILRQWLDCCIMEGGILVAQQRIQRRPLLVAQMVEEWLNHYRRMCPPLRHAISSAQVGRSRSGPKGYASDGSDD